MNIHYHNGIIKHAIKRVAKHKVSRFAVIGIINTLTDIVLLNILRVATHTESNQPMKLIILNIVSASSVAILSFYLNRKYVFKTSDVRNHMFIPFLAITLASIFILQSLVISFALHSFDPVAEFLMNIGSYLPIVKCFSFNFYETNVAKICATFASMIWNYVLYNRFVFVKKQVS